MVDDVAARLVSLASTSAVDGLGRGLDMLEVEAAALSTCGSLDSVARLVCMKSCKATAALDLLEGGAASAVYTQAL